MLALAPSDAPPIDKSIADVTVVQSSVVRCDYNAANRAASKLLDDCFWKSDPERNEQTQQYAHLTLGWDFVKNRVLQYTKEHAPVCSELVTALSKYCTEPRGTLTNVVVRLQRAADGYFVSTFDDCSKTAAGRSTRQGYVFLIDYKEDASVGSIRQCHTLWTNDEGERSAFDITQRSQMGPYPFKLVNAMSKTKGDAILDKGAHAVGNYIAFTGAPIKIISDTSMFFVRPRSAATFDAPSTTAEPENCDVLVVTLVFDTQVVKKAKYLTTAWRHELDILKSAGMNTCLDQSILAKSGTYVAPVRPNSRRTNYEEVVGATAKRLRKQAVTAAAPAESSSSALSLPATGTTLSSDVAQVPTAAADDTFGAGNFPVDDDFLMSGFACSSADFFDI